MDDPRVLLVAKHFPPCNCWPTASERAWGLACAISDRGWAPVVLTRRLPEGGCRCGARASDGRDRGDGATVEVIRVPVRDHGAEAMPQPLARRIQALVTASPDDWHRRALSAARRYLRERGADIVWTTSGPIGSARVGHRLQREFQIPWVAELRDSLSRAVGRGGGTKASLLRRRASLLARPLRSANAFIHVSPQEADADAQLLRASSTVIPSGFDEPAWARVHAARSRADPAEPLTVLFAGHAYPGRAGYRVFFDGVARYASARRGGGRPVRVEYLGSTFERFVAEAGDAGALVDVVDRGRVSLRASREAMRDADGLVLVTAPPGCEGSPGGKLYEYLASCRPIIAVPGADGFVADLLLSTGHGVCAPDPDAVFATLDALASGSLAAPAWPSPALQPYTWTARADRLAQLLTAVLRDASGRGTSGVTRARVAASVPAPERGSEG